MNDKIKNKILNILKSGERSVPEIEKHISLRSFDKSEIMKTIKIMIEENHVNKSYIGIFRHISLK